MSSNFAYEAWNTVRESFADLWAFNKIATAVVFGLGVLAGALIF